MSKFDILTKYIPIIKADNIDEWVIDKENDGAREQPIQIDDMILIEKNEEKYNGTNS